MFAFMVTSSNPNENKYGLNPIDKINTKPIDNQTSNYSDIKDNQ
jgi:hypothetical protein